jgi:L-threonylcarbamoyladenylate synthase
MFTTIVKCDKLNEQDPNLLQASELIKSGDLVAFPTETVYGLGADAFNAKAVKKIYKAKKRPADNPLIVHISSETQLPLVASHIPKHAKKLIEKFWPGPLSLVLPKNSNLPPETTAGLDTVVVRYPNHPIAQSLITNSGTPIAAPSANISGKVSPTRVDHVIDDLYGRVPLIIDGGNIEYGLESTVVDCSGKEPIILRPGSITLEMIKELIPNTRNLTESDRQNSPGMKYRHYAPAVPITLFSGPSTSTKEAIAKYIKDKNPDEIVLIWHLGKFNHLPNQIQLPTNAFEAAPELFHSLRTADKIGIKEILVQGYDDDGVGAAIMNRLNKAATDIVFA